MYTTECAMYTCTVLCQYVINKRSVNISVVYCVHVYNCMYYVHVYSVMSVRDELEKCEYLCSICVHVYNLNVLCTGVQCYVST